jgi:hypothetical protein
VQWINASLMCQHEATSLEYLSRRSEGFFRSRNSDMCTKYCIK